MKINKNSLNAWLSQLKNFDRGVKYVSFDVFDTLLRRRIAPPDQVKVPAAKAVVEILKVYGTERSLGECFETRKIVTRQLHKKAAAEGRDPECHIRRIIENWLRFYLPQAATEENINAVLSSEIDAEMLVCYPVVDLLSLIKELRKTGKTLLFTSDMYLGSAEITKILDHAGYSSLFDKGYVSADIGLTKRSGRLFTYILEKEGIFSNELVHIGDDYLSDVCVPQKLGINTYHFQDSASEKWAHRHRKLYRLSKKSFYWEGLRWVDMTPPGSHARTISSRDQGYALGYWLLGPFLFNFIYQVIQLIGKDNADLVLFPSREGFILKALYDRLSCELMPDRQIPSCYLFLSRQSVFLPSIRQFGERELNRGLSHNASLRQFLIKFNLIPDKFKNIASHCGFKTIDDPIDFRCDANKLKSFVEHPVFLDAIRHGSLNNRLLLHDYLGQFGFWRAGKVAFVDVGWDGTIQEALWLSFGSLSEWPMLKGYYIALLGRTAHPCLETAASKLHGIYFDHRKNRHSTVLSRFTDLFETVTRAPHGTTLGYRRCSDGAVIPVLDNKSGVTWRLEKKDNWKISSVQAGILDYADYASQQVSFQELPPESHSLFHLSQIDRLIRFPYENESRFLRMLSFVDGFEGSLVDVRHKAGPDSPSPTAEIYAGQRFRNPVVWREGLYAGMRIPGVNLLYNTYRALFKQEF